MLPEDKLGLNERNIFTEIGEELCLQFEISIKPSQDQLRLEKNVQGP